MKKRIKKAFTLVELLVVIAILAVLSTVAVVGYNSFTEKANVSADQQAVTQINKVLQATEINDEIESVADVVITLGENGLDVDDYKALSKGNAFYWVKSENKVVLANESKEVVYPKELVGEVTYTFGDWFSLSGTIKKDSSYTVAAITTIANAGQFADLANKISEGTVTGVETIELSGDIDLMGSSVSFGKTKNLTINGNGHELSGLRADSNILEGTGVFEGKKYGYGLFGEISGTVEVSNLKISNFVVAETKLSNSMGYAGIIAGNVLGSLTLTNVTIEDCVVNGSDKAGSIAGRVGSGGSLKLVNVDIIDTVVYATTYGAKLVGVFNKNATINVDTDSEFTNLTVEHSLYRIQGGADYNNTYTNDEGYYLYSDYYQNYSPCITNNWYFATGSFYTLDNGIEVNNRAFSINHTSGEAWPALN